MMIKSPLSFFEAEFWFASLVSDCQLSDLSLKDWRCNYLCSCFYFQMVAQTKPEHGFGRNILSCVITINVLKNILG